MDRGLQSRGLKSVGHDLANKHRTKQTEQRRMYDNDCVPCKSLSIHYLSRLINAFQALECPYLYPHNLRMLTLW